MRGWVLAPSVFGQWAHRFDTLDEAGLHTGLQDERLGESKLGESGLGLELRLPLGRIRTGSVSDGLGVPERHGGEFGGSF